MIKVYTDGSYLPLQNNAGGAGVFIIYPCGKEETIQHSCKTNGSEKMERKAVELAIQHLEKNYSNNEIVLYSDCQSVLPYAGKLAFNFTNFKSTWVKGHSGVAGNEKADKLAGEASKKAINKTSPSTITFAKPSQAVTTVVDDKLQVKDVKKAFKFYVVAIAKATNEKRSFSGCKTKVGAESLMNRLSRSTSKYHTFSIEKT